MNFESEMQAALELFLVESREILQVMEESLLGLEQDPEPKEAINNIFRAAHTIKGSSGMFGLHEIVGFTHVVEGVLEELRSGKISVSHALISILLPCCDHISALLDDVNSPESTQHEQNKRTSQQLIERLQSFTNVEPYPNIVASITDSLQYSERFGGGLVDTGNWHISLRFDEDSLRNGMDPLSFIAYLAKLGEIVGLTTVSENLPLIANMNAETCYLGFEIDFKTEIGKEEIESVFEFVRDSSFIHILPPNSRINEYIQLINALPEDNTLLGEILINSGVLTLRELEDGLQLQQNTELQVPPKLGEILVKQNTVQPPIMTAALEKQRQIKDNKSRESQSIRVDAERLDKLIELVGELVISSAAANLRAKEARNVSLQEANAEVITLVEQVRDSALQLRMVAIGGTFSRFQRVVRDVSAELGKDIALVINGGDTEVDKSVVEKISDPLMHLVRNAMDHGIEHAEVRVERGKPAQGLLTFNAYHQSGGIVIEISDDGGGLNRDKILSKALERGLVQPGVHLSDQEIYALIFEPGFSTADQISNLSGRGVGMDVVKRNIAELRGSIQIDSLPQLGTTLRIHLPLTLAIIDGFLIEVGNAAFVVPLNNIVECIELPNLTHEQQYFDLRGEILPFVRLRQVFNKSTTYQVRRENVVVVEHAGTKIGLVVDKLAGELQTVIKPLGKLFSHVNEIGGSTILGNGQVALVLDIPALITRQERLSHSAQLLTRVVSGYV